MSSIRLISAVFLALMMATSVIAGGDADRGAGLADGCADCHGEDGMGDEDFPRIAGLDEAYLAERMAAFKSGELADDADTMTWVVEDYDEQELVDLAAYFASLQVE
jgi:cytochrome c553